MPVRALQHQRPYTHALGWTNDRLFVVHVLQPPRTVLMAIKGAPRMEKVQESTISYTVETF